MAAPVLTILGDVGLTTGNVRHQGDVRISGFVAAGFTVEAAGNILVMGEVRGAQLVAAGDITVRGSVSGPDAVLDAIGTVRVGQASDAKILAGVDIEVGSAAERCELSCALRVLLSGPPGVIRGGIVRAGVGVETCRVAASCGEDATIEIGDVPFSDRREEVALRLEFTRKQVATAVKADPGTLTDYRRQVGVVRAYRHLAIALERRLKQIGNAEAAAGRRCYLRVSGEHPFGANVSLARVRNALTPERTRNVEPFVAALEDGEVHVRPLKESIGVG
jgi:hypothetical protein